MRWAHLALDVVGAIGFAMGLWRVVQQTRCSTTYDEGILLSHTWVLLTQGGLPFRDFYTQYPPGIYVLLAAIWKVFGISVMADRILSEVLRVGIALLAGVTAGRLAQRRFAVLPAALVMMWLSCLPGPPFAWLGALLAALAAMLALERALALRSRPHLVAAGALLGATFSFRHDLGIYLALALIPVGAYALAVSRPRPGARQALRAFGYLAAGAAPVVAVFWLPTLVAAKWSVIYRDLYADQVRYVMPYRKLPLPPLLDLVAVPHLPFRVPIFLDDISSIDCALVMVGPALAAWVFLRTRRRSHHGLLAALVGALCLAVIPHILGRSDYTHLVYAVPPALLLLGAIVYGRPETPGWRVGLAGLLVVAFAARATRADFPPHGPILSPVDPGSIDGSPLMGTIADPGAHDHRLLREYVASALAPGEPVYIGNQAHDSVFINEVNLHFLLEHPPVQRYLQFDPGIITRSSVQKEMIRALEARRPRIAILSDANKFIEGAPDAQRHDSKLLDVYLESQYQLERMVGPYKILRRRQ